MDTNTPLCNNIIERGVFMRYSGRDFTDEEINWIKTLIQENPGMNRQNIARTFCNTYNWLKKDGDIKLMSCKVAFLKMHRKGIIALPEPTKPDNNSQRNNLNRKTQNTLFEISDPEEILLSAGKLDLSLELVNSRTTRKWNELINEHHYLGYKPLPGAQLRYIVRHGKEIIACLGFGASAWSCAPRDRFIGWDTDTRKKNLQLVVNNARFLILPWVKSKNLATKILSMACKRLQQDWQDRYNYKPVLLETFVEKKRFTGTCYKAANWINVGDTKGLGKKAKSMKQEVPVKSIWLYPLDKKGFREVLCN